MFKQLGWSQAKMQKLGGAGVLGGLLMVLKPTRRLGASIVVAASATLLMAELENGDGKLAMWRGGVLLTALAGLVAP